MLIQIIIALLIGILAGTITGLIPGIHINLIGALLLSLSFFLAKINSIYLVTFITSMAMTHTFLDFIPSIFLGCPDTDTELSILPGHELLKKGQGYQAIILTAIGSFYAIFILLLITSPSIKLIPLIYKQIQKIIPYILIIISIILITLQKNKKSALIVFILTGILGFLVLNSDVKEPLFPLLTGLFGLSNLLISIKSKTKIPKQETKIILPKNILKPLLGATIAAPLCSFLPGLGSGQAAVIGNSISRTDRKGFLILLGATNTLVMGFSFLSLYLISKTRTGAAATIQKIAGTISLKLIILILIIILITGIISFFLTIFLAKNFSKRINKINYSLLSKITIIILVSLVTLLSGFKGLFVLTISSITGIYSIMLKVKRTNMMGCLLIPTILLYLI